MKSYDWKNESCIFSDVEKGIYVIIRLCMKQGGRLAAFQGPKHTIWNHNVSENLIFGTVVIDYVVVVIDYRCTLKDSFSKFSWCNRLHLLGNRLQPQKHLVIDYSFELIDYCNWKMFFLRFQKVCFNTNFENNLD